MQFTPAMAQFLGDSRISASRSGGLLGRAGGARQHSPAPDIHIDQFDPVIGEHELPHLIRVGRAPRLQHEQQPVAFTVGLGIAQHSQVSTIDDTLTVLGSSP